MLNGWFMEKKNYNASIDIFKYFCAIMIVDSHVRLINIERSFLFDLFRFALYFFHCSFGFYYFKGLRKDPDQALIKNVKRLIVPIMFWSGLYLLLNYYNNVLSGEVELIAFIKLQIKSVLVNGTGFHLWFMYSCIFNVLITTFFYKRDRLKTLYYLSVGLYIIGLLGSYYYPFIGRSIPLFPRIVNHKYFTTICRLFLHGLPMFVMGIFISDKEKECTGIKNGELLFYSMVFFVMSCFEILFVNRYYTDVPTNICSLFLAMTTFPFFILLLKNPMLQFEKLARPLKYISTFMYLSHALFRTVIGSVFMRLFEIELSPLKTSALVVLGCTVCGFILYKINNRYLNRVFS